MNDLKVNNKGINLMFYEYKDINDSSTNDNSITVIHQLKINVWR